MWLPPAAIFDMLLNGAVVFRCPGIEALVGREISSVCSVPSCPEPFEPRAKSMVTMWRVSKVARVSDVIGFLLESNLPYSNVCPPAVLALCAQRNTPNSHLFKRRLYTPCYHSTKSTILRIFFLGPRGVHHGGVTSPRLYTRQQCREPSQPYILSLSACFPLPVTQSLFIFVRFAIITRLIFPLALYTPASEMAPWLNPARLEVSNVNRTYVPLPETTCYTIPYGTTGFASSIVSGYIVITLLSGRTPLFPWRRTRHRRLFSYIVTLWAVSTVGLQLVNLGMCARSGTPLVLIIVGKLLWSLIWICAVAVNGVNVDRESEEAVTATVGESEGNATGLETMNASTTNDPTIANDGEGEDDRTRLAATNDEAGARAETPEPRVAAVDGKSTTPAGGERTRADNTDISGRILEDTTGSTEPPPAYESIARYSEPVSRTPLLLEFENQQTTASSSRSMGTQTDLPPSPTVAAEALSTNAAEEAATTAAQAAESWKRVETLKDFPEVVGAFIIIGITILLVVANFKLGLPVATPSNPHVRSLVWVFFGLLLPFFGAGSMLVLQTLVLSLENAKDNKGQYMELKQVEDEETCSVGSTGENQDGTDGSIHNIPSANLAEDDGGAGEERETSHAIGDDIASSAPDVGRLSPIENCEPIPSKEQGIKTRIRVPRGIAYFCASYGGVLSVWFSEFLLGATTANTLGLPRSSKLSMALGIAYLVASKLLLLCF